MTLTSGVWGLIPAHAGKTVGGGVVVGGGGAHPRSRGENGSVGSPGRSVRGSSPLTRGKRDRVPARFPATRLIPAHAGKTGQVVCPAARSRAHPRSRGENYGDMTLEERGVGSSPLTRGKPMEHMPLPPNAGLIPAHAGKTSAAR